MVELLILVMLVIASCLFGNGFVAAVEDVYQIGAEKLRSWRRQQQQGQLRLSSNNERDALVRNRPSKQGRI